MTKAAKCGLSTHELHLLNQACVPIRKGLGTPYLVGTAGEGADYRDVDVRVVMPDDEFDRLFSGQQGLWELMCFAIGHYLRDVTKMPVDFQIQRMTEANERYPGGGRNPLGVPREFAGGGDATNFGKRATVTE